MESHLVDAFAHLTLDVEANPELVQWVADELLDGRGLAEVADDLSAQGWAAADVEAAVEEARVQTRQRRGIVTRDDVARSLERRYRQSPNGRGRFFRLAVRLLGIVVFFMAFFGTVRLMHTQPLPSTGGPPAGQTGP